MKFGKAVGYVLTRRHFYLLDNRHSAVGAYSVPDTNDNVHVKISRSSRLIEAVYARTTSKISNYPQSSYIVGLDGMRAISIAMVFLGHYGVVRAGGMFGVQVFFVISGFIISRTLIAEYLKTNDINVRLFYIRRFIRLSPNLYIVVTSIVVVWTLLGRPLDLLSVASGYFYFSNYYQVITGSDVYSIPLWSLAVEEHFYIIFPVLFSLWLSRSRKLVWHIATLCLLILLWRVLNLTAFPDFIASTYIRTDTRIDAILFGVMLGIYTSFSPFIVAGHLVRSKLYLCLAFGGLVFSYLIRSEYFRATLMYTIQGASIAYILGYVLFSEDGLTQLARRFLEGRLATTMGRMSYALYLWHLPILVMIQSKFGTSPLKLCLAGILSLTLSFITWHYVDRPMLTIRRRFGSHAH